MPDKHDEQAPLETSELPRGVADHVAAARPLAAGFDVEVRDTNGDESWGLPMPAHIVVDMGGEIRGIDADPDHTRRPEPEATTEILRTPARPTATRR